MTRTRTDADAVAGALLEQFGGVAARRRQPVWLEWRGPDPEAREVGTGEGLLGSLVAPEWDGAAVVGTGRLRLLDESHEPPAGLLPGLAGGLTLSCVVTRDGQVGWRMRLPDGTFHGEAPSEGLMLDILLRSLGLPTPPPAGSVAPLELAAWVAAIGDLSVATGRRLSWQDAVELQPALGQLGFALGREEAAAVIGDAMARVDWEDVRAVVVTGVETTATPPPWLAAWMDAGMFSRWVLGGLPPLAEMLALARAHMHGGAYRWFAHVARRLDHRAGPVSPGPTQPW